MTRRSQMETYIDILKAVAEGRRKPTHIMYRSNLCWERLKKQLDFLVKGGLLEKAAVNGTATFSLTSKGKDLLGYHKKLEAGLYCNKRTLPTEVYVYYK